MTLERHPKRYEKQAKYRIFLREQFDSSTETTHVMARYKILPPPLNEYDEAPQK